MIATLLIILLLAISNDYSLRKLGTRRWKSLQGWTYYFVGLLAIHSVLYQLVEHRPVPFVVLFAAVMVLEQPHAHGSLNHVLRSLTCQSSSSPFTRMPGSFAGLPETRSLSSTNPSTNSHC